MVALTAYGRAGNAMSEPPIPEAAVEAAARAIYERTFGPEGWGGLPEKPRKQYADDARFILEAAAPHMLADIERDLSDAKRVIALLVSEAGGKAAISRKSVTELPADIVIETTQDIINGGWVIRAKARAAHGDD